MCKTHQDASARYHPNYIPKFTNVNGISLKDNNGVNRHALHTAFAVSHAPLASYLRSFSLRTHTNRPFSLKGKMTYSSRSKRLNFDFTKPQTHLRSGFGAGNQNRTDDLVITNDVLYRLSHTSDCRRHIDDLYIISEGNAFVNTFFKFFRLLFEKKLQIMQKKQKTQDKCICPYYRSNFDRVKIQANYLAIQKEIAILRR